MLQLLVSPAVARAGSLGSGVDPAARRSLPSEAARRAARRGAPSSRLVGAVRCVASHASVKLVTKNSAASTPVAREKKVAEPRAPNTVPDAPAPNPVPASAPLPRCNSTRPMINQRDAHMGNQYDRLQHFEPLFR